MKNQFTPWLRSALIMIILCLPVTLPAAAQEIVLQERFDNPDLPGWEHSENAQVVDGVLRIESGGIAHHLLPANNVEIHFRLRFEGEGTVEFHYRETDASRYLLRFSPGRIALVRVAGGLETELALEEREFPPGEWIEVMVVSTGGYQAVSVNDWESPEIIDPDPLPPGGILFHVEGNSLGEFDDLLVFGHADQPEAEALPDDSGEPIVVEPLPIQELSWIRLGGPPGGLGYDIRYSFDDPNIWYVTDANAGVHISRDNGLTWEQSNTGIGTVSGSTGDSIPIFSLTVDPHDASILWAGTDKSGQIYKSVDGGETWQAKDRGIIHEFEIILSFRGFTVDPRSSDVVYAMGETQRPGNNVWGLNVGGVVYKTVDGGENWELIWDGGIPSSLTRYMWIDPRDPDLLYVSTGIFDRGAVGESDPHQNPDPFGGLGILKSTDGGSTWKILGKENGLDFLYVGSLYMHPDNPDILLAATGHLAADPSFMYYQDQGHCPMGIYRTTDGGESWTQVLEPEADILIQAFSAVEICLSDTDIVYAGSDVAVYRSQDGGDTWTMMSGGPTGWGPTGVRAGWPIDMQCDPRNPDRVFANNYSGGNFLSEDGGRTWINASSGYSGAQVIGVAVDPFNPARIFAGGRSGAWYSEDGGTTWKGLHNPGEQAALAGGEWGGVAFDPSMENHILAGGGEGFLEWEGGEPVWKRHGAPEGYGPETSVIEFAPSNPSIVYAGSANHNTMIHSDIYESGRGVIVSQDGGSNWVNITGKEFQDLPVTDLSIDSTDANIVYAATQGGLFKTIDGGTSWTPIPSLSGGEPVRTVGLSPADPQRILAGVQSRGLYLTEDGGVTWRQVTAGLEPNGNHRDIIFDPTNPEIVYTSDISSGVYRSEDGGLTWLKLYQGLTTRMMTSLSISANGLHLYAATSGGGLFRLDLNGEPPVSTGVMLFGDLEGTPPEITDQDLEEEKPSDSELEPPEEPQEEGGEDQPGFSLPCLSGALPLVLLGAVVIRASYFSGGRKEK
ncbi:MAG: hypothetical protein WBB69_03095 [Anaerolineales bacterium]